MSETKKRAQKSMIRTSAAVVSRRAQRIFRAGSEKAKKRFALRKETAKIKRRANLSEHERALEEAHDRLRENKRDLAAAGFVFQRKHTRASKTWMAFAWICGGASLSTIAIQATGFLSNDGFTFCVIGGIVGAALSVMRSDSARSAGGEDDLEAIHRVFVATDEREELRQRIRLLTEAVEIERATKENREQDRAFDRAGEAHIVHVVHAERASNTTLADKKEIANDADNAGGSEARRKARRL